MKQAAVFLFAAVLATNVFAETPASLPPATPAPADAKAFIVSPANGATVPQTFTVKFGLKNMAVAPAGTMKENAGHHHLLIDMDKLPALDQPLGQDVKHFGKGQTETEVTLPPGKHTLQLILGDYAHRPHNPPVVSEKIEITVK